MTDNKKKSKKIEQNNSDKPLLDITDNAVKRMIKSAKSVGYVTYEVLNKVLPSDEFSSEQIEDVTSMLSEMGISVVEHEEQEEASAETPTSKKAPVEKTEKTDDPVRMYLREMGSVDLLSREG